MKIWVLIYEFNLIIAGVFLFADEKDAVKRALFIAEAETGDTIKLEKQTARCFTTAWLGRCMNDKRLSHYSFLFFEETVEEV